MYWSYERKRVAFLTSGVFDEWNSTLVENSTNSGLWLILILVIAIFYHSD